MLNSAKSWNAEELQAIEDYLASEQQTDFSTIADFGPHFFRHFLTSPPSHFHRHLIADLDCLQTGERRCYIAPRGSAKSTWSTLINVLKRALDGSEHYIIIISDIQANANKFLKAIKDEVEGNEDLRKTYRHCRPGAVWREEAIELPNGCRIEALGKGGKIRGRRHRQHRPTLIVLDDPQSFDDAYSPTQMEKDWQWLMSDVMKAGSPDTNFIVLGTALADECIVCKLEKTAGWKFKRFRQLQSEPTNVHLWHQWREILWRHDDPDRDAKALEWYTRHKDSMDDGAQPLWPERVPLYEIMKARYSEGERAFMCEQQGEPMPPGDAFFRGELFDWPGFWFDEWPTTPLIEVYGLDPSMGKEARTGDYQAIIRIAMDRYYRYFVECWMEKMNPVQLCEFIVDRYRDKPGEAVAVEFNGFQQLLEIPLQTASAKLSINLPIYGVSNTTAKPVRIMRLARPLESHEMFFKAGSRGTQMLIDQMKKFRHPAPSGQHDDGPDALETAKRVLDKLWIGKTGGNRHE